MQRILLIEDCPSTLSLIANELTTSGFEVSSTTNACDGLEILMAGKFDVVVSDLNMASLSGFEILARVKEEPSLHNIPVVIITGDLDDENRFLGMEVGAAAWMCKPFRMEELTNVVRSVV